MGYPFFRGIQLSFTDTNTLTPTEGTYVGFDNYQSLLASSDFSRSVFTTLTYASISVLGALVAETQWLASPSFALPAVSLITIWMTFPFTSLVFLAALQSIPSEIYEAAKIDGASAFKLFRFVTLPLLRSTTYVLVLLLSIWSLRRFDLIWVLTQGGPVDSTTTLVLRLYRESFVNGNLGFGAAIGTVGFALSILCTAVYFFISRNVEESR